MARHFLAPPASRRSAAVEADRHVAPMVVALDEQQQGLVAGRRRADHFAGTTHRPAPRAHDDVAGAQSRAGGRAAGDDPR